MKLSLQDRRLWVATAMLVLIALPLGFAFYGSRTAAPTPAPTPTLYQPPLVEGLWRMEGSVVDEAGKPLEGVCLAIGPLGCRATSPKSDAAGKFYFDLPPANVDYDLHFSKTGYQTLDVRIHPSAPSLFNYVLKRG